MTKFPVQFYHVAKISIDAMILAFAYAAAWIIRYEGAMGEQPQRVLWATLPFVVLIKLAILHVFGVPRLAWRCAGWFEIGRIVKGVVAATCVLVGVRLLGETLSMTHEWRVYLMAPLGVIAIDATLSAVGLIGVRGLWRRHVERTEQNRHRSVLGAVSRRALLVGTGPVSIRLAREIKTRPRLGVEVEGLLAESVAKIGMHMNGIPVLGAISDLKEVARDFDVQHVIIPLSEAGGRLRDIVQLCQECGVAPQVFDEGSDKEHRLNRTSIRQVTVEDLLRREPVRLDGTAVPELIRGKTVLVTGAGGSIGSQLCREVCKQGPGRLVLVEQAENNLFQIHRALLKDFPNLTLVPAIADITDLQRVEQVLRDHGPQVVFHAAAHKHVPMMEWNVSEAIKNNVLGTQGLADLSHQFGVGHFVMVSTDKAVRPTSVMGVSKRVAELYVQALAQHSRTCFVTVRFGNVLGSAGSVIPIFQEQIAAGGPITVTHPDMQRYFMTIPEACQLILEAASLGKGGEIFVLDMGQPVKIVDLATDMIRLCGLEPGVDVDIEFTGIRPGEKLFEELSLDEEQAERTRHPRIFIGRKENHDLHRIRLAIHELSRLAERGDPATMRAKFKEIVPEFILTTAPAVPSVTETLPVVNEQKDTPTLLKRDKDGSLARANV
jgi:FlaA1/EpsC-like NDP-sugar epimerase